MTFLQNSPSLSEINGAIQCGSESIELGTLVEDALVCEAIKPNVSVIENLASVQFSLSGKESPPMSNYELHYKELCKYSDFYGIFKGVSISNDAKCPFSSLAL